jgi:hypothetical protein
MDPADPKLLDGRPLLEAFLDACRHRKATGKPRPVRAAQAA